MKSELLVFYFLFFFITEISLQLLVEKSTKCLLIIWLLYYMNELFCSYFRECIDII